MTELGVVFWGPNRGSQTAVPGLSADKCSWKNLTDRIWLQSDIHADTGDFSGDHRLSQGRFDFCRGILGVNG